MSYENFDTSLLPFPQDCANCGQKRKARDGLSMDNEGYHGDVLHDNSLPNTYRDNPSTSQGPSTWRGDTSGVETIRFLGGPEYSYRNVRPRRSPETVRGNLSGLDDHQFFSATSFTY